jgi:quercetin dioxygenase-like cupin family protein
MNRTTLLIALALSVPGSSSSTQQREPLDFVEVLPQNIRWAPNPAVPGSSVAILVGDPNKPGPLVVRVRLPAHTRIAAHTHPDARTYTVLSGEWQLGFGEDFDASLLRSYPAGSIYRLPAGVAHFQSTGGAETIFQIESIGPTRTDFTVKK